MTQTVYQQIYFTLLGGWDSSSGWTENNQQSCSLVRSFHCDHNYSKINLMLCTCMPVF